MPTISICSKDYDVSCRVEEFRDVVSNITKVDFLPDDPVSFQSETSIGILQDLIIGHGQHSASTALRSAAHAAEGGDNVMFHIPLSGGCSIEQKGGERVDLKPGTIYADPCDVAGTLRFHGESTEGFYVSVPRVHLAAAGAGLEAMLRNAMPLTPQWRLFFTYAHGLHQEMAHLWPEDIVHYTTHVQDLALIALGATREAAEIAQGRGVRAARLREVKADIERHLVHPYLSAQSVAARSGLSPRYLRALFEGEGTSFGDYVATRRLAHAHRMLSDARFANRNISQIAMDCGFGDLSWFNARFRRAYGMSPKDVRARSRSTD
ncbi:helix-turn-helix transcriptional regulator [Cohaesibacter haloalkalitolerans]|uniref:helix-turn-helix transcriptional regulator n=1 Tax=Cohaesibacter haloalkalitolerans TaxID=1162980 RepID=UPI001FE0DCEB|nr:AraC family transcriptional regulator [Cohaesibacter haloalkalitolerans]